MIPNEENKALRYLAVKKLPTLIKAITLKEHGDF